MVDLRAREYRVQCGITFEELASGGPVGTEYTAVS